MLRSSRLSCRRAAALAACAALGALMLGPETTAAAAFQSFTVSSSSCETVTTETNLLPPPNDWETVWTCVTTASTNAAAASPVTGVAVVTLADYQNASPCSPSLAVDLSFEYFDAFGLEVSFEATGMPYATINLIQCETNYPLNGRITPTVRAGAYSGMDEVCQFHVIGSNQDGTGTGDLLRFSMDNQKSTSPCPLNS